MDTARLRDGQSRARALADQPGFQLGNRRHLRDQERADRPGRHRGQVAEHDTGLAAALHHGQEEPRVRASRSSLAMTSTARRVRQEASAAASCGRSVRLPLSTS